MTVCHVVGKRHGVMAGQKTHGTVLENKTWKIGQHQLVEGAECCVKGIGCYHVGGNEGKCVASLTLSVFLCFVLLPVFPHFHHITSSRLQMHSLSQSTRFPQPNCSVNATFLETLWFFIDSHSRKIIGGLDVLNPVQVCTNLLDLLGQIMFAIS